MFWSDWGKAASISSAHMDGTNKKKIVSSHISIPQGLAIDYTRGRIYWADTGVKRIENAKFDGTDRQVVIGLEVDPTIATEQRLGWFDRPNTKSVLNAQNQDSKLPQPVGLDVYGDEVFWTDPKTESVLSANKISGKNLKTLLTNTMFLNDVQVYHKERKIAVNRCARNNGGCSHLCLLKPNGYSCRCPVGIKLSVSVSNGRCANEMKRMLYLYLLTFRMIRKSVHRDLQTI
jgi:hypothetical protein